MLGVGDGEALGGGTDGAAVGEVDVGEEEELAEADDEEA